MYVCVCQLYGCVCACWGLRVNVCVCVFVCAPKCVCTYVFVCVVCASLLRGCYDSSPVATFCIFLIAPALKHIMLFLLLLHFVFFVFIKPVLLFIFLELLQFPMSQSSRAFSNYFAFDVFYFSYIFYFPCLSNYSYFAYSPPTYSKSLTLQCFVCIIYSIQVCNYDHYL